MNGDHIDQKTIEMSFTKRAAFFTLVILPLFAVAIVGGALVASLAAITDELNFNDSF